METQLIAPVPMRPANKGTAAPSIKPKEVALPLPEAPKIPANDAIADKMQLAQAKRLASLKQAVATSFALSDKTFTFYKDTSGQYITRFTSLRDGSVTYIPEPSVQQWLKQGASNIEASLTLDA